MEAIYAGAAVLLDSTSGLAGFEAAGDRPYFGPSVPAIWLPVRRRGDRKKGFTVVHELEVTPGWLEGQYAAARGGAEVILPPRRASRRASQVIRAEATLDVAEAYGPARREPIMTPRRASAVISSNCEQN